MMGCFLTLHSVSHVRGGFFFNKPRSRYIYSTTALLSLLNMAGYRQLKAHKVHPL